MPRDMTMKEDARSKKRNAESKSTKKNLHVLPRADSWVVRVEDNSRAISTHNSQRAAIEAGRDLAQSRATVLVIHGRDGRVRSRDSYNPDPLPPKVPRKVLSPTTPPRSSDRAAIKRAVADVVRESNNKH